MANPGTGFCFKGPLIFDAPIEALLGQDSEFCLGHVEPAFALWRVMPFEALRLLRFKGFVKGGGRVGVKIILNQDDLLGFSKMRIA